MRLKRIAAALLALALAVFLLPRLEVSAAAKYVEICGYCVSADTERLCFYTDAADAGELLAKIDVERYTKGDFDRYYILPKETAADAAEIAEKLPKIKRLAFIGGRVENTDAFAKMKVLSKLELYHTDTADISFLKDIGKNLKLFRYKNSGCEDITPLKYLKNVQELRLDLSAKVGDPAPIIKKLTKLKRLELHSGKIINADFLKKITGLTELELESANLDNISALEKLTELKTLSISSNSKEISFSPLKKLKKLEELTLGKCGYDISPIGKLKNLRSLYLYNYGDEIITADDIKKTVSKLTGLERFSVISCGKFGGLGFLSKHKKLKELYLFDSAISDVSGIKNLTELEVLDILYNNFGYSEKLDISPLKKLTNLTELNLSDTPITDASVIRNMSKLEWLSLSGTEAEDLSPVLALENLKRFAVYDFKDSDTLEKFRKKYPKCEIVPYFGDQSNGGRGS